MICPNCEHENRKNTWTCGSCNRPLDGGLVIVTGISGTGSEEKLEEVRQLVEGHGHRVRIHDVGKIMRRHAVEADPDIEWDMILNVDPMALAYLRALAFQEVAHELRSEQSVLHVLDLHLSFRWRANLTKGIEPYMLRGFLPHVRCLVNLVQDLAAVQERLDKTAWGRRRVLELLIWRDEELFLSDVFANMCGVDCFAVSVAEPGSVIEDLIWHPEKRKIYLSFPITGILEEPKALSEIATFRDTLRSDFVVFDPFACKDYDETYKRQEMKELREQVGETTVERDFRFIDQADALVAYFPRKVASKGVDAEMNHARRTGKPIFLYSPEDLGGGPFAVPPTHFRNDPDEYFAMLKEKLPPKRRA